MGRLSHLLNTLRAWIRDRKLGRGWRAPMAWWNWKASLLLIILIPLVVAMGLVWWLADLGDEADAAAACGPGDMLLAAGQVTEAQEAYQTVLSDATTPATAAACARLGLSHVMKTQCEQLDAYVGAGLGQGDQANGLRAALVATPGVELPCGDIESLEATVSVSPSKADSSPAATLATRVTAGIDHLLSSAGLEVRAGSFLLLVLTVLGFLLYLGWVRLMRRYDSGKIQTAKFLTVDGKHAAEAEARFREAIGYLGENFSEAVLAPAPGLVLGTSGSTPLAAVGELTSNKAITAAIDTIQQRPTTTVMATAVRDDFLVVEGSGAAGFPPRTALRASPEPKGWTYVKAAEFAQGRTIERISPHGLNATPDDAFQDLRDRAFLAKVRLYLSNSIQPM